MGDRKRPSRRDRLFPIALTLGLALLVGTDYWLSRDERAAARLLQITNNLTLGHTTRAQFFSSAEPYRNNLLSVGTVENPQTAGVMTYRFYGHFGRPVVMAISVTFSDNVVVGRDVGLLRADCCSVETGQQLQYPANISFGSHLALRKIVGDPAFVKFEVAPGVDGQALRDVFDYRTDCLGPFNNCDSVEKINPHAAGLLRESLTAGY